MSVIMTLLLSSEPDPDRMSGNHPVRVIARGAKAPAAVTLPVTVAPGCLRLFLVTGQRGTAGGSKGLR
jgi:hypothetical protein